METPAQFGAATECKAPLNVFRMKRALFKSGKIIIIMIIIILIKHNITSMQTVVTLIIKIKLDCIDLKKYNDDTLSLIVSNSF